MAEIKTWVSDLDIEKLANDQKVILNIDSSDSKDAILSYLSGELNTFAGELVKSLLSDFARQKEDFNKEMQARADKLQQTLSYAPKGVLWNEHLVKEKEDETN